MRNAYKILSESLKGKLQLGKPYNNWEDIKMNRRGVWIEERRCVYIFTFLLIRSLN
jgi:hypothetical protein